MLISVILLTKYIEIKYVLGSVHELSRSKLKQAFLIDSDAERFMYLIQCIRFGS